MANPLTQYLNDDRVISSPQNQTVGVAPPPSRYPSIDVTGAPQNQTITNTQTLPYGGGTYNPSVAGGAIAPAPIFTGAAPTASTVQPAAASDSGSKYINPQTGEKMSPQEYALYLSDKIPKGSGDILNYAGDAMTNPNQSAKELKVKATNLNNARNDIATGTTDPYGVGNKSGIAYSPTELKAIESAYAGVYDPVLNDVFAKLKDKEDADKAALTRKNMLEEKAIEHKYRMSEKSSGGLTGPQSYQEWTLAGGLAGTGKTYNEWLTSGDEGSFKSEIAGTGRQAVANMLEIAEKSPGIFGRTAALWMPESARSDAFRNYSGQLDSLKGNIIPAALTAMREASKTGGALGQVSDKEGAWLSASLGALEMSQSPTQIVEQLKQIDAHLATWQNAVENYSSSTASDLPSSMELNGETLYLQSDGTYE